MVMMIHEDHRDKDVLNPKVNCFVGMTWFIMIIIIKGLIIIIIQRLTIIVLSECV